MLKITLSLSLLITLCSNLILPLSSFSQTEEETITITTYYPAPFGVYNEMRSKRMAVGTNYYNGSAYPWDTGGGCTGNEICNADLVVQGNVGIGTTKPDYKLSFGPDTGGASNILAFVDEASPNNAMRGIGGYNSGGVYGLAFWASLGDAATISNTRMFIDANTGNVGIGTTSPGVDTQADTAKLEVVSTSSGARTTGLYLKNNAGAAGTAVSLDFSPNVNAPLARINANRTTVSGPTDLEFWTYTGGAYPADFTNKLTIKNTGNVGIGTAAPNANLDARGVVALGNTGNRFVVGQRLISGQKGVWITIDDVASNVAGIQAENAGVGYFSMALQPFGGNVGIGTVNAVSHLTVTGGNGDANGFLLLSDSSANPSAGNRRAIYVCGTSLCFNNGVNVATINSLGSWVDASDISIKKDIQDLSKYGLSTVMRLKPREYKMKAGGEGQIGFIAQEVNEIIPEVVSGEQGSKGLAYGHLTAVLAKAIQEQQREIEELREKLASLEAEN